MPVAARLSDLPGAVNLFPAFGIAFTTLRSAQERISFGASSARGSSRTRLAAHPIRAGLAERRAGEVAEPRRRMLSVDQLKARRLANKPSRLSQKAPKGPSPGRR
jgi:hypothetical protein